MARGRTYRTGIVRKIDNHGRIVLSKEQLEWCHLDPGQRVMMSVVVDKNGKVRGILCEPMAWVADPSQVPTFDEVVARIMEVEGEGPGID